MKRFLITLAATIAVLTASASAAVACDSPSHGGYQHWNPPTWHQPAPCPPSPPVVVVTPPAPPVVTPPVVIVTQTVVVIAPAGPTGATGATGPSAPTVTAPASDTLTAPAVTALIGKALTILPNDTWHGGRVVKTHPQVQGLGVAQAHLHYIERQFNGKKFVVVASGNEPLKHVFSIPAHYAFTIWAVNGNARSARYTRQ